MSITDLGPDPWCPQVLTAKPGGRFDYVDLFAGAGGWDVAAADLGLDGYGIENDATTCLTRFSHLLHTVEADVRRYSPGDWPAWGLVASPPCQTFSTAGKKNGHSERYLLAGAVHDLATGKPPVLDGVHPTSRLVVEPMRWLVEAHREGTPYRWVAMEQVPAVLPVWQAYAWALTAMGYSAVTGIISAERYGVPQTRRRAVLLAHYERRVELPKPTHSAFYPRDPERRDPGLLPWVSISEALWNGGLCPHPGTVNNQSGNDYDLFEQCALPATALAARRTLVAFRGANANRFNGATKSRNDGLFVTVAEAARLQTFPRTFHFCGTEAQQVRQIGNAIPPTLARALLAEVA